MSTVQYRVAAAVCLGSHLPGCDTTPSPAVTPGIASCGDHCIQWIPLLDILGPWDHYSRCLASLQESYCASSSCQPVPLVYEEEAVELVMLVPAGAASSLDNAVILLPSCQPNEHWRYQDLLQWVADYLQISLEKVRDPQHHLQNILQPQGPYRVALPINEAILELTRAVWHTPALYVPTLKRDKGLYILCWPKGPISSSLTLSLIHWWCKQL